MHGTQTGEELLNHLLNPLGVRLSYLVRQVQAEGEQSLQLGEL